MFFGQEVPNYVLRGKTNNCEQHNWSCVKGTVSIFGTNSSKNMRGDRAGVRFVEIETEHVPDAEKTKTEHVPDAEKTPSTSTTIVPAHASLDIPEVIPKVSHSGHPFVVPYKIIL